MLIESKELRRLICESIQAEMIIELFAPFDRRFFDSLHSKKISRQKLEDFEFALKGANSFLSKEGEDIHPKQKESFVYNVLYESHHPSSRIIADMLGAYARGISFDEIIQKTFESGHHFASFFKDAENIKKK